MYYPKRTFTNWYPNLAELVQDVPDDLNLNMGNWFALVLGAQGRMGEAAEFWGAVNAPELVGTKAGPQ